MENVKKKRLDWFVVFAYLVIGLFALCCVLPFLLVIMASVSSEECLLNGVTFFPQKFSGKSYLYLFQYPMKIVRAYGVSIFVTVSGTLLNMFMMLPFAYAISKQHFVERRVLTFVMFFTVMFSGGIIPTYMVIKRFLNLFDTIWVLFVPWVVVPGHIVLLRVFFSSIPQSLFEAAELDGGSEYSQFFHMGLPLIKPGIATIAFFSVLQYWNDSYTAIIYTENPNLVPVQVLLTQMTEYIKYIRESITSAGGTVNAADLPSQSILFAMCVVAAGPVLVLFSFFQKYFVRGLTVGSVKG